MFCRNCGSELKQGALFCTVCGTRVLRSQEPSAEPAAPAEAQGALQGEQGALVEEPTGEPGAPHREPTRDADVQQQSAQEVKSVTAPPDWQMPVPEKKQKKNTGLIIGIVVAVVLLAAIVLLAFKLGGVWADGGAERTSGSRVEKQERVKDTVRDTQDTETVRSTEDTSDVWNETTESAAERDDSDMDDLFNGADSGFIFPNSGTEKLTEEEIEEVLDGSDDPAWTIRIAINELYARHGRIFDTEEIRDYFEAQDWYEGTIDGETFDKEQNDYLNDAEIYNRDLLSEYRKQLQ